MPADVACRREQAADADQGHQQPAGDAEFGLPALFRRVGQDQRPGLQIVAAIADRGLLDRELAAARDLLVEALADMGRPVVMDRAPRGPRRGTVRGIPLRSPADALP